MTVTLLLALSLAAPPDGTPTPLDGVWAIRKLETRDHVALADRLVPADRFSLVVFGGRYALNLHAGTIAVDTGGKAADLAVTDGWFKGVTLQATYDLSGDTLTLAVPSPTHPTGDRPPADVAPAQGMFRYTFQRDARVTPEQAAARLKAQTAAFANPVPPNSGRGAPPNAATEELLRQVVDRLDRIERRLDAIETAKR